jgi:hypothetical protein
MLDLEDPANRRVVEYFARHDERGRPREEAAFYPSWGQLTTHPEILEYVWTKLGSEIPAQCARFVHGTAALVHDRSGIVLAFGWGTTYGLRLPNPQREEALAAGQKRSRNGAGGRLLPPFWTRPPEGALPIIPSAKLRGLGRLPAPSVQEWAHP